MSTNYAVPTGEFIAEWLEENAVTRAELARRLNRSRKHVSQLVCGKVPLSPEVAEDLAIVTGVPARIWNGYEAVYRADLARLQKDEILATRFDEAAQFPLNYLRKRRYLVADRSDRPGTVRQLLEFFGVADFDSLISYCVRPLAAYRQSQAYEVNDLAVAAWIRVGAVQAGSLELPSYDESALRKLLPELRALTVEPVDVYAEKMVSRCRDVGVAVIFDRGPDGTRCSGVTQWVNGTPVVQLTDRGKKNDIFWFTFFHELGHVLLHPHNKVFIEGSAAALPELEAEADTFARDLLIPRSDWERRPRGRDVAAVKKFADDIGIHPGIVIGRIHRETENFTWGHGLKQSIRIVEE